MNEVWKEEKHNPGYFVSNFGNFIPRKSTQKTKTIFKQSRKYLQISMNGKICQLHPIIAKKFLEHCDPIPNDLYIDHKDGNTRNNNINNLQLLTSLLNNMKKIPPKSKYATGVHCNKKYKLKRPFRAQINNNGKTQHLGYFKTEEEASKVYQSAWKRKWDFHYAALQQRLKYPNEFKMGESIS